MASSSSDSTSGTLRVWNLNKGREVTLLVQPEVTTRCLSFTPDGQNVLFGKFNVLKVWNWKTREKVQLEGHSEDIETIAISADGQTVISGSCDRTINVWNLSTRHKTRTLSGHSGYICAVAISGDGQTLISSDSRQQFKWWNLATGEAISIWEEDSDDGYSRTVVAMSADGRTLAGGCGNTVKVWRVV